MPPPTRSAEDDALINSQPYGVLIEFRDKTFHPNHVASRPERFLGLDWINTGDLREFLVRTGRLPAPGLAVTVKKEPEPAILVSESAVPIGRVVRENGKDVVDLCSDSDGEADAGAGTRSAEVSSVRPSGLPEAVKDKKIQAAGARSNPNHEPRSTSYRSPLPLPDSVAPKPARSPSRAASMELVEDERDDAPGGVLPPSLARVLEPAIRAPADHRSPDAFNAFSNWRESGTEWGTDRVRSYIRKGAFKVTSHRPEIQATEYVFGLAPYLPIHEERTLTVIDVDFARYDLRDGDGRLRSVDNEVKNHDNDAFKGPTGRSDKMVKVRFGEGEDEILAILIFITGGWACAFVDSEFFTAPRRYLEPEKRSQVFAAQRRARATASTTEELRVAEAVRVLRNRKCSARDASNKPCTGVPIIVKNKGTYGGEWCIDCSGRTAQFNVGHIKESISVDQDLFLRAWQGMPMTTDKSKDTSDCGGIIHPTTGNKLARGLEHTHILDGVSHEATVVHYPCNVSRSIYVPVDTRIRKVAVLHDPSVPHAHLLPAFTKKTHEATAKFEECVYAAGVTGTTTVKVEKASSTPIILEGKTPAEFAPALQSKVLKNKIVRDVKQKVYKLGVGIEGALGLHRADLSRPAEERYIHRFVTMGDSGTIVVTAVPGLLRLLDDEGVNSFEADTTYKRVLGEFNEWEVVVFYRSLNRAITIARVYVDRASTDFYERVFDELNALKVELTGKPVSFKALVPGGNLLAFNSDMDSAQVVAAARSFLKTSVEAYSGIPVDGVAEDLAPRFVKLCKTHFNRAILDFKTLISKDDLLRLLKLAELIESSESLRAFSDFLPLVEAIETARVLDLRVWNEVQLTFTTGILTNPYNDSTHRLARNLGRQATATRKRTEAKQQAEAATQLDADLAEATARVKDLKAQKAAGISKGKGKKRAQRIAGDSSSGRVKSRGTAKKTNPSIVAAVSVPEDMPTLPPVPATPALVPDLFADLDIDLDLFFSSEVDDAAYSALPSMSDDSAFYSDLPSSPLPANLRQGIADDVYAMLLERVMQPDTDVPMPDANTPGPADPVGDAPAHDAGPSQPLYLPIPRPSPSPPPAAIARLSRKRKAEVDIGLILSPSVTRQRRLTARAEAARADAAEPEDTA
uniref:Uncharacterized protein n=1 Tax=Mycena chlorophos TaxID=658473 RepID=A0ABQ0L668_MYCCL|nr:predicted protein [Mycena chlorophos]